ncbi:MAG: hypothetical protein AAF335_03785 [Bacteroidota bacterium]
MKEQLLARKKQMKSPTKREAQKNNLKPLQQNSKPTGRIITDEQRENEEIKELEEDLEDTQKEIEKELNAIPDISEAKKTHEKYMVDSGIDDAKFLLKLFRKQLEWENQKESCDPKTIKEIEDKIRKEEEKIKLLTKKMEILKYQEKIDLPLRDKKNRKEHTSSLLIEDQLIQRNNWIKQHKESIPRGTLSTTASNTSIYTVDTLEKKRDQRLKKIAKGIEKVRQKNKKKDEKISFLLERQSDLYKETEEFYNKIRGPIKTMEEIHEKIERDHAKIGKYLKKIEKKIEKI